MPIWLDISDDAEKFRTIPKPTFFQIIEVFTFNEDAPLCPLRSIVTSILMLNLDITNQLQVVDYRSIRISSFLNTTAARRSYRVPVLELTNRWYWSL